ncbi:MAG TPA: amino acid ABC transporter permease [Marmoricola sp.]|nr:amino acid ABC transporter permease [Marmoricola sp.]
MSTVLYDHPGPKTVARHRLYTVIAIVVLAIPVGLVIWRMADRGQFRYALWEPFVTPDYIRVLLVDGLWKTLQMAFLAIVFAIVFGLVFGVGKLSDHAWIRWPSWLVVEFFRAVPVLLLMVFIFYTYGIGDGFGPYWSVVFALTLYNGSVLAEVFRAGVNAVPAGQAEAAYAIGMRKNQVMRIVQLPQAIKIMLPSIISQMVVALKDTSLGYYIAVPGLTFVGKQIYGEFNNQLQTVIVVALLYISVNLLLTLVATRIQKRLLGENRSEAVGRTDAESGLAPEADRMG